MCTINPLFFYKLWELKNNAAALLTGCLAFFLRNWDL